MWSFFVIFTIESINLINTKASLENEYANNNSKEIVTNHYGFKLFEKAFLFFAI